MKFEEIRIEWEKDSVIDKTELAVESLKIPILHSKYYNIFIQEAVRHRKFLGEQKILLRKMFEYYSGEMSLEEMKVNNLEIFQRKLLKADIEKYISSDKAVIEMDLKVGIQRETIDFLESILKTINNRGFQIKNAIDFLKFQNGGN
jgi:hypothetical protein